MNSLPDLRAAVICSHCSEGVPILRAVRSKPVDDADSGWQFLCGVTAHNNIGGLKVWSIEEILEKEPTLKSWLDLSYGTAITRPREDLHWGGGRCSAACKVREVGYASGEKYGTLVLAPAADLAPLFRAVRTPLSGGM